MAARACGAKAAPAGTTSALIGVRAPLELTLLAGWKCVRHTRSAVERASCRRSGRWQTTCNAASTYAQRHTPCQRPRTSITARSAHSNHLHTGVPTAAMSLANAASVTACTIGASYITVTCGAQHANRCGDRHLGDDGLTQTVALLGMAATAATAAAAAALVGVDGPLAAATGGGSSKRSSCAHLLR